MAKVVMFPQKMKIPKGVEDHLCELAKDYVETLAATASLMGIEQDESKYDEFMNLMEETFTKGIIKAVDEMR